MEVVQIKQALLDFMPQFKVLNEQARSVKDVRQLMEVFLKRVLGYDPEQEIVFQPLKPCRTRKDIQFNDQVKFIVQSVSPGVEFNQTVLEHAVDCALDARAQLLVLTNGTRFVLYDIDASNDELEVEPVFELNLLVDDVAQMAVDLWTICKMDCEKKVIINSSD
jgi:hypothetical protein